MSGASELVERLRREGELLALQPELGETFRGGTSIFAAADELSRLSSAHSEAVESLSASRAEVVALRGANDKLRTLLRPFAEYGRIALYDPRKLDEIPELCFYSDEEVEVTVGDFRRARAALAGEKPVGAEEHLESVEKAIIRVLRWVRPIAGDNCDTEDAREEDESIAALDVALAALSKSGEKP